MFSYYEVFYNELLLRYWDKRLFVCGIYLHVWREGACTCVHRHIKPGIAQPWPYLQSLLMPLFPCSPFFKPYWLAFCLRVFCTNSLKYYPPPLTLNLPTRLSVPFTNFKYLNLNGYSWNSLELCPCYYFLALFITIHWFAC